MLQFNNTKLSLSSSQQEFINSLQVLNEKFTEASSCPFDVLINKDKYKKDIDTIASAAEFMRNTEPVYPGIREVNLPRALDSVVANLNDAAKTLDDLNALNYDEFVPFVKKSIESAFIVIESEFDELLHRQSQIIDEIESE